MTIDIIAAALAGALIFITLFILARWAGLTVCRDCDRSVMPWTSHCDNHEKEEDAKELRDLRSTDDPGQGDR